MSFRWFFPLLWLPLVACALPPPVGDPAGLAMAGAGAALADVDYRPRLNPAAGALASDRDDVHLRLAWSPEGRTPWPGNGAPVEDRRLLGGELGLPHLPVSLGAFTQARFTRIQGASGSELVTREAWRIESGADVARLWVDRAGQGRRIGVGVSAKLVSLRLRAAREAAATADPAHPRLQRAHDGRLDLDVGALGTWAFRWRWALVARDLFAGKTPWPDGVGALADGPSATAALAWRGPRWSWAADLDLTARHRGLGGRERRLALGLAWATGEHLTLRAGAAPDLLGHGALRLGGGVRLRWGGLAVEAAAQKQGPGGTLTALGLEWAF